MASPPLRPAPPDSRARPPRPEENGRTVSLQILTLKPRRHHRRRLPTWCRDSDPPALDFVLRSVSIDADPLGDSVTAILDWNQPPLAPPTAATAAGLPLSAGLQVHQLLTDEAHSEPVVREAEPHLTEAATCA